MPYVERLKDLLEKDKHNAERKTNKESGPAGPLNIEKARDWEVTWDKGRAILLKTPRVPTPSGEDMPKTPKYRPEIDWDRGGSNTGPLPNDPNGPIDKLQYRNKDTKVTEGNTMSYVKRLAAVLAKSQVLLFKDVLKMVKILYPDLRMQFPKPPTYVWNPKKAPGEEEKGKEVGDDIDETAKLEPQKIKDKLKVKLPQLKWTARMTDGIEQAELGFEDESTVLFEIGAKANHLTLTYYEPPKGAKLVYDDSDKED
jgi:hypothetical protein